MVRSPVAEGTSWNHRSARTRWAWAGDPCPTLPPGALPAPNGFFIRQWEARQRAKAALDFFVVYRHEWLHGALLGPYGAHHVGKIAHRLPETTAPVVIEPDLDPAVNAARVQTMINLLTAKGVADAPARIIVGQPMAEGLYGDEAQRVYFQILGGGLRGGGGLGGFGGGLGGFGRGIGGIGGFRGY